MEEFEYRIIGPATNARVQDITNEDIGRVGDWFEYGTTIPSGSTLIVRSATWALAGINHSPSLPMLKHSGSRFLTVAMPRPGRAPRLRLTASNTGSSTALTVTGRRVFQA